MHMRNKHKRSKEQQSKDKKKEVIVNSDFSVGE